MSILYNICRNQIASIFILCIRIKIGKIVYFCSKFHSSYTESSSIIHALSRTHDSDIDYFCQGLGLTRLVCRYSHDMNNTLVHSRAQCFRMYLTSQSGILYQRIYLSLVYYYYSIFTFFWDFISELPIYFWEKRAAKHHSNHHHLSASVRWISLSGNGNRLTPDYTISKNKTKIVQWN